MPKFNFKVIFIILGIVTLFFLGKQCGNGSKNDLKPLSDTIRIHTTDTIHDSTTVFKMKEKRIFKHDTIFKYIDTTKYSQIAQYRLYQDTIRDSNIVIFNHDTVLGYITSRSLSYRLLVPLKIYDSTKVTINNKVPTLPKYQLKVGLTVNPRGLSPNIDLSIKRNTYSIGYDPFNKIPYIGYKYTLWYSR
jgi:hypothetical protein